jgi:hypothetical protein
MVVTGVHEPEIFMSRFSVVALYVMDIIITLTGEK